jgi:hypothetical protein
MRACAYVLPRCRMPCGYRPVLVPTGMMSPLAPPPTLSPLRRYPTTYLSHMGVGAPCPAPCVSVRVCNSLRSTRMRSSFMRSCTFRSSISLACSRRSSCSADSSSLYARTSGFARSLTVGLLLSGGSIALPRSPPASAIPLPEKVLPVKVLLPRFSPPPRRPAPTPSARSRLPRPTLHPRCSGLPLVVVRPSPQSWP